MYRLTLLLTLVATGAAGGEVDQSAALTALQRADSVLIDVRTEREYAEGSLPGSVRIETRDLPQRIASVAPDKDAPIVLYCRSGSRSSAAQDLLHGLGYSQVINAGGYEDLRAVVPSR